MQAKNMRENENSVRGIDRCILNNSWNHIYFDWMILLNEACACVWVYVCKYEIVKSRHAKYSNIYQIFEISQTEMNLNSTKLNPFWFAFDFSANATGFLNFNWLDSARDRCWWRNEYSFLQIKIQWTCAELCWLETGEISTIRNEFHFNVRSVQYRNQFSVSILWWIVVGFWMNPNKRILATLIQSLCWAERMLSLAWGKITKITIIASTNCLVPNVP